jgi:hypothetical protein
MLWKMRVWWPSVLCLTFIYYMYNMYAVAQLVEALCYKPEGRGFDSRWCHWMLPAALLPWG